MNFCFEIWDDSGNFIALIRYAGELDGVLNSKLGNRII